MERSRLIGRLLRRSRAALSLACLAACLHASPVAAAGGKVALVIGNAAYDGSDRLQTPVNDARRVGDALRRLGFDVHVATNLSIEEFKAEVNWLADQSAQAGVVLFYFAGHGFESNGENFLVPVHAGAPVASMTHAMLVSRTLKLAAIRASIRHGSPPVTIALIDACRTSSRGGPVTVLKREPAAHGELIAYSTSNDGVAYDSMRTFGKAVDDSPFAWFLAPNLQMPGATIKQALEHTQQQVADVSAGGQQPWIASGLNGDFVLAAPAPARANGVMPPPSLKGDMRAASRGTRGRGGPGEEPLPALPQALAAVRHAALGSTTATADATDSDDGTARADAWDDVDAHIANAARDANARSIAALRTRARQGDATAMTTLGLIYDTGAGGTHDRRAALAFYRQGAAHNFPVAQALLGETYMEGKLLPHDLDAAERLLAPAAAAGLTRARLDLFQVRAQHGQGDQAEEMQAAASLMMSRFAHASKAQLPEGAP
ncbi:caspase family protein [Paraburkholderia lycopersici]|uniref:Caspase domain-containing protein n=1 Tax=Paraburkholderia lycopersici TaxID=416944 RepID=A0A1G7CLF9_9BURK|nr:caspase family protein [Paraburkholderia lycopersici]SDE40061.1 Caspase domain-containing protein [Paraburkholderia lycopersici]